MAPHFTEALDAEIAKLQKELEGDPRYVKLSELRRVRGLYNGDGTTAVRTPLSAVAYDSGVSRPEVQPPLRRRSSSPERQAILDAAKTVLADRAHPTPTIEIYEAIKDRVEIPGKVPRNNLSAMLSNSDDFKSHGRDGWTLVETKEASDISRESRSSEASNSSAESPTAEPDVRPVDPAPGGGT